MDELNQNQPVNQLTVVETKDEYLVVWDNNHADWVARFKKDDEFPARMWAERMQSLFVERGEAE